MLNFNELEKGVNIIIDNQPHEILEAFRLFKGRGQSVLQVKTKNLITGTVVSKTFHPSDTFEEAEIKIFKAKFLFSHRDQFYFTKENDPSFRFSLMEKNIGESIKFLTHQTTIEALLFQGKVINISLPIKLNLKVIEAPPGVQGSRSQPGTKTVTLETKAKVNTPLFIKEGDVIVINTKTGQYVQRKEKEQKNNSE
ncbi:hypothetical protein KAU51_00245 [Candidatus Parcubacteria bacterium]|nr:hypothetical protein [Candidatus Parcubacteria bacterium]